MAGQQIDGGKQIKPGSITPDRLSGGAPVGEDLAEAKGDIIVASGPDVFTRLPVGNDDEVLTVDVTAPTGVKWKTGAAAGHGIQDEGSVVTERSYINFTGGGVTLADDPVNDAIIVAIPGGGGGGGGGSAHGIQDEGTAVTARGSLNFVGEGVVLTDDALNDRTTITIDGGGGHAIEDEGVAVPETDVLNFVGDMVKVTDVAGSKTQVKISRAFDYIRFRWPAPITGIGYKSIGNSEIATYNAFTIKAGDRWKFEMYPEEANSGVSLEFNFSGAGSGGASNLRDSPGATDAYGGLHGASTKNLAPGQWYERNVLLTPWAGLTITGITVDMENTGATNPTMRFRNARIEDASGAVVFVLWGETIDKLPTLSNAAGTQAVDRPQIFRPT